MAAKKLLKKLPVNMKAQNGGICEPARCLAADPKRRLSLCMYEASKDDLMVKAVKCRIATKRRVEGVT